MFTIGDFAQLGRVSVRMLRHYDAVGLLLPAHVDPSSGYRYYTAASPRATPFLPEGVRNYYSAGMGLRPNGKLSADVSFQYINQPDRAGAVIPEGPRAGVYSATGVIFNFTVAYRFGGGM